MLIHKNMFTIFIIIQILLSLIILTNNITTTYSASILETLQTSYIVLNDTTIKNYPGEGTPSNPYVVDLDIRNLGTTYNYIVYINDLSYHVVVKGVISTSYVKAAVYIGGNISKSVAIEDLSINSDGFGDEGILVESSKAGVEIYNVSLTNTGAWGIYVVGSSNIIIHNIYVRKQKYDGILVENSNNITLKDISISITGNKGVNILNSKVITIDNALITNAGESGIHVEASTNINIFNIQVYSPYKYGVDILKTSEIRIENITVKSQGDSGLILDTSKNAYINGVSIGEATASTLYPGVQFKGGCENIYASNIVVHDLAGSNLAYGIAIWNSGRNITLTNIKLYRLTMGIEAESVDTLRITNFEIRDISSTQSWNGHAINLKKSSNIVLESGSIKEIASIGVRLETVNNLVVDNVLITACSIGVIMTSNSFNIAITNSNITASKEHGILLWDGHDITINNCLIDSNTYSGIRLNTGVYNVLINSTIISRNGHDESKISHKWGVYIPSGVHNVKITYNSFLLNYHTPQVYCDASTDEVYISHNYWSDYTGKDTDKDGIGDRPYILASSLPSPPRDNSPLMKPITKHLKYAEELGAYPLKPETTTTTTSPTTTTTSTTTASIGTATTSTSPEITTKPTATNPIVTPTTRTPTTTTESEEKLPVINPLIVVMLTFTATVMILALVFLHLKRHRV